MDESGTTIILSCFGSRSLHHRLNTLIRKLGYASAVLSEAREFDEKRKTFVSPLLILPVGTEADCHNCLSFAMAARGIPILCVYDADSNVWDTELMNHCHDFVGWPCHEEELRYRIERIVGGSEEGQRIIDRAVVEEIATFNMQGTSTTFVEVFRLLKKFARCDAPVLVLGETGTGKELACRALHYLSARRDRPFVPVTCGAIPNNLFENEVFGHEKGAFTDAKDKQLGLIVEAQGGTLFLDEVDTLALRGQAALLRFLDRQEYRPLGNREIKYADVRIVAASNTDLGIMSEKGLFRYDLLYRLGVLAVRMPPLRDRGNDVELLANHFIRQCSLKYKEPVKTLCPETLAWMRAYAWPGNVRELQNLIHRQFLVTDGPVIHTPNADFVAEYEARDFESNDNKPFAHNKLKEAKAVAIAKFERAYLQRLMAETRGNVTLAAKRAGKERRALGRLLKKYDIDRTQWSSRS